MITRQTIGRFEDIIQHHEGKTVNFVMRSLNRFVFEFRGVLRSFINYASKEDEIGCMMFSVTDPKTQQKSFGYVSAVAAVDSVKLTDGTSMLQIGRAHV